MAREPAERYQKASELRNALAEFVEGSRPASAEPGLVARSAPAASTTGTSRRPLVTAAWVIAVLAAVGIGVAVMDRDAPEPPPQIVTPVIIPRLEPPPPAQPATAPPPVATGNEAKAEAKAPPKREEPPPPTEGTVALAVTPWGEVLVDGVMYGVSPPLTQLTLPAGKHTVEIRNGSFPPFVLEIDLAAGEKIQLQHRF
jgi:eukaryotic-like serine/threonine-protein kinase